MRVYNLADNDADTTAIADTDKGEGTYSLSGNIVTATYSYPCCQYSTEATVNVSFNHMEGTWGNGTDSFGAGTFFLDKQ